MKRCTLLLSLCLLLCACTPAPGESAPPPDATAGAQTAETAETATGESAGANTTLPAGLEPLDRGVLDYDNIRLVCRFSVWNEPVPGYFTASRDGQWGLLRNDGSEVLPCTFDRPVALCSDGAPRYPAWILSKGDTDAAYWEETSRYLASIGEGMVCDMAHCGPGYEYYLWLTDRGQMCAYIGSLGPSLPTHIAPAQQADYSNCFPTRDAVLVSEEWGEVPDQYQEETYRYRTIDGTPLNNYEYQQAQPFLDGALLAAAKRGSRWVYLDQQGREVTDPAYEGVYSDIWDGNSLASPLLNGYAAVCRDGRYGLLDSAGQEFVPCAYDGLAWDGRLGWIKLADGWHGFTVPSAPAASAAPEGADTWDPLQHVPIDLVFPDICQPERYQPTYRTISYDNLNVRAGPGVDYDKVDSLPPGSPVTQLGRSSATDGWIFVAWQDRPLGWVSTEYLK